MEENLLKLDMLGHDDPTMIRMMEDLTGVDAKTIPLDDKDTMSHFYLQSKILGFEERSAFGPHWRAAPFRSSVPSFTRGMLGGHPCPMSLIFSSGSPAFPTARTCGWATPRI